MEACVHQSSSEFPVSDFVDISAKQKHQYDTFFALKSWRPKPLLHPETTKSITDKVLASPRMKDTIFQLLQDGDRDYNTLVKDAKKILEEMGHTYSLKTVRFIGFFLAKLLRQLYQGLSINQSGVLKLSDAMSQGPVLFLPTHRSYADFLLISYLCFTLNVPLPVIAAGMDFKGMKVVNRMLQNAGAFYIRRSFGQDQLYWAAVSEYIQYHINNFQAPIEFFLEGTRSRNGKSLTAKTGLLTMALEPYLKGDVPDIKVFTISISYERTLEENLYAYELLGVPKPRESTSGFLSAIDKLRGQNYGRIYLNISNPISVREHIQKRSNPNWNSPSFRFFLSEDEKKAIHSFANHLVCKQQKETITPISAIIISELSNKSLAFKELVHRVELFNSVLAIFGTPCLTKGDDLIKFVENCLVVHKHVVRYGADGTYGCPPISSITGDLQAQAAARLVLQHYSNQLLGPLINLAVFGTIKANGIIEPGDVIKESIFFGQYFKDEFVLVKQATHQDLELYAAINEEILGTLKILFQPFIESFYVVLHLIIMGFSTLKEIQLQYRNVVSAVLAEGVSAFPEILAIDKVPRHLHNLVSNGLLIAVKNENATSYKQSSESKLSSVLYNIEVYLDQRLKDFMASNARNSVLIQSQL